MHDCISRVDDRRSRHALIAAVVARYQEIREDRAAIPSRRDRILATVKHNGDYERGKKLVQVCAAQPTRVRPRNLNSDTGMCC